MLKKCNKCKRILPITEFWRNKCYKDGYYTTCKQCFAWYTAQRRKRLKLQKLCVQCKSSKLATETLCETCRQKGKDNRKRKYYKMKKAVLSYYNNKCQICGITDIKVLDIDHINGSGAKMRRQYHP